MSDIDAWLVDSISVNDGVLGLVGFDDDRAMNVWSTPHYERALSQRLICAARLAAAEWALADVERRAAGADAIANSRGLCAAAKAEWGAWDAQVTRLTNARPGR
jgi:hypothetical protein